jgi:uncharacterized repeat protein (TIGR01451 family)
MSTSWTALSTCSAMFKRFASRSHFWLYAFLWVGLSSAQAATPTAGTVIGNQASATYTDASNVQRTVTSNVVTAVVQQVASLTLTAPTTKAVTAGGQVVFPLTLSNTGNGPDAFALSTAQSGAFSMSSVQFYLDANGDGQPDDLNPITSTGPLQPGAVFKLVAVAVVPTTPVAGDTQTLTVTATSSFAPATQASVAEQSVVSANAVINVSKAMSASSGDPGSGPFTITLTYTNTGNTAATSVVLKDALPSGMTYVAGSGRWSSLGSTVLTDALDGTQGTGQTITYDYNATSTKAVTASISSVPAGQSGTLTFEVSIDAFDTATATGQLAGALQNTASVSYHDGASNVGPTNTNTVSFQVNGKAAVSMAGQTVSSASQGSTVVFVNALRNMGNRADSFDITVPSGTFPPGTTYTLFQADGATPLVDTNGNGTPDTGLMASGASYNVVMKVQLPAGASGGPYSFSVTATSRNDALKSASASDVLSAVVSSAVDLTNTAALGGVGVTGVGAGPEATAQSTVSANPGATVRFVLYVNNTSAVADSYDLAASTIASFATLSLPSGWTVQFKDAQGTVITNTGVLNAGVSKLVYADVSVPAQQAAMPSPGQLIYFRVVSPSTGAIDRKTDAVVVNTLRSIQVSPNNSGQVFPGGTVVYSHVLTNNGNVTENSTASAVALSLSQSQAGFSAVVYRDLDNNGQIDPTDTIVNNPADLGPLVPGASLRLLVKVSAAAGASVGLVNSTNLIVTTSGVINGSIAPASVAATDASTVISGNVVLLKDQALDANCDGLPDAAYSTGSITSGAVPGACIRYRIRVANNGTSDVLSVIISDATPANTTYHATAPAATTQGTVTAPASASTGTVSASVGTLVPAGSATVTFGVRINP